MSFIIKGFDTDGNCLHCYFQSEDSDRCILTDDDMPLYGKGHPESCPLVPLPEGHGELIEKKSAKAKFCQFCFWKHQNEDACERCAGCPIDFIPTIVPAEGGGEDGN